jgi:peptidoglycan/LPS O-acetylase OafA/YrhL
VPEMNESRRFAEIVAGIQADEAAHKRRRRGRVSLGLGIALCVTAAVLVAVGGPKGAVLAVVPWLAGMILVVKSRAWH